MVRWGNKRISNGVVFLVAVISLVTGLSLIALSIELGVLDPINIEFEEPETKKIKRGR